MAGDTYLKMDSIKGTISVAGYTGLLELETYSFDAAQTLTPGSQPAGAGRVSFNPFTIRRTVDEHSPAFFLLLCNGMTLPNMQLIRATSPSEGANLSQKPAVQAVITFKTVAMKTYAFSDDGDLPKETISFEYGGLQIVYYTQTPDGRPGNPPQVTGGWNRITNQQDNQTIPPS
jgi:type VI protein secretion system component Hcp